MTMIMKRRPAWDLPCVGWQVMTHVLDALGTAGVAEVQVERIALVMVDVATKVDTDESVSSSGHGGMTWHSMR